MKDEDDEGLGLDIEDDSRNEEGRRNGRGEGVSERGRLSRASVSEASEGGDAGGFSWPSSRASVTAASEGAAAEGGGVDKVLGRHHCHHERLQQDPTHPLGVALKHI